MSLSTPDQIETKAAKGSATLNAPKSSETPNREPGDRELGVSIVVSIAIHCLIVMFTIWGMHHLQDRLAQNGSKREGIETLQISILPDEQPPSSDPVAHLSPELTKYQTKVRPPIVDDPAIVNRTIENLFPVITPVKPKVTEAEKFENGGAARSEMASGTKPKPTPQKGGKGGSPASAEIGAGTGAGGGRAGGGRAGGTEGWDTPGGEYPPDAQLRHIEGTVRVTVTTDGSGKIIFATATGGDPLLLSAAQRMARETWKGPPNAKRTVEIIYRLGELRVHVTPLKNAKHF